MANNPTTTGNPAPFLGDDLYELSEADRIRELTQRTLDAEERARKRRGKAIRIEGYEGSPYDF